MKKGRGNERTPLDLALRELLDRYRDAATEASERGHDDLYASYAYRRDCLAGIVGYRCSQKNRQAKAARRRNEPRVRDHY